jgi:hypothetical protein
MRMQQLGRSLLTALGFAWRLALAAALALVRFLVSVVLAIVLLFEEWGWQPLARLLAELRRFRLWTRFESWVASLPPYGALVIFALPSVLLFPLKLLALALLAKGKVLIAGALLAGAKIVGTAFVARVFTLVRPQLMQLAWFARLYHWFVPRKEALFAWVRASWVWRYGRIVKSRAARHLRALWHAWAPSVTARLRTLRARLGTLLRRLTGKSDRA